MSLCMPFISVIFVLCLFHTVCPSCIFQDGKYDLSMLDWPKAWQVSGPTYNTSHYHYEISLCRPLKFNSPSLQEGCPASSICQITGNKSVSFGNAIENPSDIVFADNHDSGFSIYIHTKFKCGTNSVHRATINFACGPNLGAPELILRSECQVNFYWRTSAACPPQKGTTTRQVPCYVIDDVGNKRDLSPLILKKGGYSVNTPSRGYDFIINVCSDIVSGTSCPLHTAACRSAGSEHLSFGGMFEGLRYSKEGLILTYETNETFPYPAGCQLKPKTTILFKCPSRGRSHVPKLISDSNCQYEVEWETEYACPENLLKGNFKACQFTMESHGIEIDLSPLRKKVVNNIAGNDTSHTFALSVCGGLGNFSCGVKHWKSSAVCMINGTNHSQIIGTTDGAELMYADGEVILAYSKGDACDEGVQQTSVINFVCDPNAGDGEPRHVMSSQCVHIFEWPTKHSCLKHPLDTPCSVTYNKKTISLQKLLLKDGEAWLAVDGRSTKPKYFSEYFINVCGRVSNLSNLCGEESSACVSHSNGEFVNLGNFTSPPVYDNASDSVRLTYTGGSPCRDGKLWQSTIDFMCRPGHISSEPILMRVDDNECQAEFEWHTAEACPLGVIEGSDCKVYDSNLGINYDLTPLRSKFYQVESDLYTFHIGVCGPLKSSPCNSKNVGVCQVDKSNQTAWKLGEPTSQLSYMDGVVNLTYLNGDPYFDQNKTARMSIIIFICNYEAGEGNPQFVEEVNFASVFHWYTSLVCSHSVSTKCLVQDPLSHAYYDLSELSMPRQNWMTVINEDNKERQVYLNVCRSLALPIGCDSNAAACLVESSDQGGKVIISNLGRAVNGPTLESAGHLSLRYTNGNPCVAFGMNTTYSTVIHFLCPVESATKTGIRFLGKIGACEYTFLWTTTSACLSDSGLHSKENCQLTDPDSGYTFDLTSLRQEKEPYTVLSSSRTFKLNICGNVFDGCMTSNQSSQERNISVCETNNDGKIISQIAVSDSYMLSYSIGQDLTLAYKSLNNSSGSIIDKVLIKFPCSNTTTDATPKLLHEEDGQYIFEMKTHLACIPAQFECNIIDELGNEYDLSPLALYGDRNWEVSDNRPEYAHLKYHLNFCRPLNKGFRYNCPGGASTACQTSTSHAERNGHDLGSQMSKPMVSNKGTIVIRYTNGSFCPNGQFRRSTTINLFCSEEQNDLKFVGETPECEYVFSLDTPVACPIRSSRGNNCMVKDPIFGYMFDLSPLKSKNYNYNVTVGDYTYSFNVCDKLNNFNSECNNSSVCQTKSKDPGFSKSLGQPNDVLVYRKGMITLKYESGTGGCHGKYNRSTTITFTCHHAHEDKDGPVFIDEVQDCTYLFEWPTVHACPPFDVIECSVADQNGIHYDLSRLSLPNDNYYVKYPDSNGKTFVINVCRSIVSTPDSLCPYTSAACLIDSSEKNQPINLGKSRGPYFENDKIKMTYSSGDPCNDEQATSARFMQTVIEFSCDSSRIDSQPEFVGKDGCTYYFDWSTAYACPVKQVENLGDCTALDPITGYIFNLSVLRDHGLFTTQKRDHQYHLGICGNKGTSPCGTESSMCQEELTGEKRHWSGGKPNSNLTFNNGVLFLNYTGGDPCHKGRFQRNTLIEFHCGHGIGEPKFLYESQDCTYFFSWKTELACQTLLHCAIKNGSQYYDLTSLAQSYHIASSSVVNDKASYYISVCNSLPKIPAVSCPPGAAICRVMTDAGSLMTSESLGKVEYPPLIDFLGHATVLYTNGSACSKNSAMQNRARIIFLCDADVGAGEPVLLDDDSNECLYVFEWRTSIVCPEKPEIPATYTSCNYTDNSKGVHFDLTPLQRSGTKPYYELTDDEKKDVTFLLNVCSTLQSANVSSCADAGICVREGNMAHSYGVASSQRFTFDGRRLRLTFYDGDDCLSGLNGKRTSEIFFICDPTAGLGEPIVHKKYTCLVVFMWKTSLVCQNKQQQCAFDIGGIHYDFNLLSSLSHNWNATDGKKVYWINMCRGIHPTVDTFGCPHTAAVCLMDELGYHMSLGLVQTMQVKSINSTDLLLTFDSGDTQACAKIQSNTPLRATTRLFMKCGPSLGQPKIFSGPDSKCFYDFIWQSSLACEDKAEEVMLEENGIIQDKRSGYTFDIKDILNQTFSVRGTTASEQYLYKINLSGVSQNVSDSDNPCSKAAVCQTKPNSTFLRDIGSVDTRTFVVRGSELHLSFVSHTRPCGKNRSKNVTTLINIQCVSAAGIGSPVFLYESGDCDYIFEWETIVLCPDFHKRKPNPDPNIEPQVNPIVDETHSSHKAEIAVGVIFALIGVMAIAFVFMNAGRRAVMASRIRSMFGRVSVPYFRYKRGDILTELQSDF